MKIKIELHTHTDHDPIDFIGYSAYQLIDEAARQGFDALAITCHNALQWSPSLLDYAGSVGILLIPGVEATIERKHALIYGLNHYRSPMSFADLRRLRQAHPEILTIAPHPYFPSGSCLGTKLFDNADCFDAIEYSHFYTRSVNFNKKAAQVSQSLGKPLVGTSDVHRLWQLGKTYSYLNVTEKSFAAISAAIRLGDVEVVTVPLRWGEVAGLLYETALHGLLMRQALLSRKPTNDVSFEE